VGTSPEDGGLKVDYTIDHTPASTYGVQVGDVILSMDNVAVSSYSELVAVRDKHQQGEAFTLNILRNGSKMNINARFKACNKAEQEQIKREEDIRRPILGVYEKDVENADGLVIGEIIAGKGAAKAGLQPCDVVTSVDGKTVRGTGSLRVALTGHQPGDPVTVIYQRDGQSEKAIVTLSGDRNTFTAYNFNVQRDPCAVFIGVYTSNAGPDGKGVKVTGVIDNTPAKESDLRPGDVILRLDGQETNSFPELQQARNKHQAGDRFRMSVLRDGVLLTIKATFKACPNAVEPATEGVDRTQPVLTNPDVDLQVMDLNLFPNPTFGLLNVRFEAEAIPTTVRITDAAGKVVYENSLRQFTGSFNEQVDLTGKTPGIYTVTMQQGKKLISKNFVLITRA
ncbi:MAG: PDZ domain-containing protein, partial [Saprospiraceae bacterium]